MQQNLDTSLLSGGWITLNRACNMRCSHCYQQDTEFDPKRNADMDIIIKEIDLMYKAGAKSVVLIGGEPTVYPYLKDVVKLLVSRKMIPILVTNGREFSKKHKLEELINAGLRHITISIKANSEYGYRHVTGTKGSFDKVLTAINFLKSDKRVNLGISVTVEEYFVSHLSQYVDFLKSLNVPHVNFDLGSPILKSEGVDITGIPDPFVLAKCVEDIHLSLKDSGHSYSFYMTIPLCMLDVNVKNELIHDKRITTTCHVSKGGTVIFTDDGNITPCNHFTDLTFGKIGEDFINVETLSSVLSSSEVSDFRKEFNSFPHTNCSSCADWDICGGGCKIKWMHYNPSDFIGKSWRDNHVKHQKVFPIALQRNIE